VEGFNGLSTIASMDLRFGIFVIFASITGNFFLFIYQSSKATFWDVTIVLHIVRLKKQF